MKKLLLSLLCMLTATAFSAWADSYTWSVDVTNDNYSTQGWSKVTPTATNVTLTLNSTNPGPVTKTTWTPTVTATIASGKSWGQGWNTTNAVGYRLGSSNADCTKLVLQTTAFNGYKVKSIIFHSAPSVNKAAYSMQCYDSKNNSSKLESTSDVSGNTSLQDLTASGSNPILIENGLEVVISNTTTNKSGFVFTSLTIEYETVPTGPVDPAWTLTAPTGLTYGDSFNAIDCYDAKGTGLTPTGYTLKYIPFADSATAPSDETWKATEALANVTYPYTPNAGWYQLSATTEADTDGKYNGITKYAPFSVGKASQTIAYSGETEIEILTGKNIILYDFSGANTNLSYNYSDDSEEALNFVKADLTSIEFTGKAEGIAEINVFAEESENYNQSNAIAFTIYVEDADKVFPATFNPAPVKDEEGKDVITLAWPNTTLTFTSKTENVEFSYYYLDNEAEEKEGTANSIKFTEIGSFELEVTAKVGENKAEASFVTVNVVKGTPVVKWSEDAFRADLSGENNFPTLTVVPEDLLSTVEYKLTQNDGSASIDTKTGVITLNKIGEDIVEAVVPESTYYNTNSAVYELNIYDSEMPETPVLSLASSADVMVGQSVTFTSSEGANISLTVTIDDAEPTTITGASPYTYTFENEGIYEISAKAVSPKGKETAAITAEYIVSKYTPQLSFEKESYEYLYGELPGAIVAAITDYAPGHKPTISYTSGNEAIVKVDANTGAITLGGEYGETTVEATITADQWNEGDIASYTIAVGEAVTEGVFDFANAIKDAEGNVISGPYGLPVFSTNLNSGKYQQNSKVLIAGDVTLVIDKSNISSTVTTETKNETEDNQITTANTWRIWDNSGTLDLRLYKTMKLKFSVPEGYEMTEIQLDGNTVTGFKLGDATETSKSPITLTKGTTSAILTAGANQKVSKITVLYNKITTDPELKLFGDETVTEKTETWAQEIDLGETALSCIDDVKPYLEFSIEPVDEESMSSRNDFYTHKYLYTPYPQKYEVVKDENGNVVYDEDGKELKKELPLNYPWMDVLKMDSWLYTEDQIDGQNWKDNTSFGLNDEGHLIAKVPCSGQWKVTVNVSKAAALEYTPITIEKTLNVMPTFAGFRVNYQDAFDEDGNVNALKFGKWIPEEECTEKHNNGVYNIKNVRLDIDGFLYNIYYKIGKKENAGENNTEYRPRKVSLADDPEWTLYEPTSDKETGVVNGIDLSNASGISFAIEKNGISTLTPNGSDTNQGKDFTIEEDDTVTAVEAVFGEAEDGVEAEVMVFTMQGVRVDAEHLEPGLYIFCRGAETRKVLVK